MRRSNFCCRISGRIPLVCGSLFAFSLVLFGMTVFNSKLQSVEELSDNELYLTSDEGSAQSQLSQRVNILIRKLEVLEYNNFQIRNILRKVSVATKEEPKNDSKGVSQVIAVPTIAYEDTRRILEIHLKEIWYTLQGQEGESHAQKSTQIQDIYKILRSHLANLRANDGYEFFRIKETKDLANLVQTRIKILQNPENCTTAKKVLCRLNKPCGFGCQIHHVGYCLIHAYATGRTLILDADNWKYNNRGWNYVFLPLSDNCIDTIENIQSPSAKSETQQSVRLIKLPYVDTIKSKPKYLPVSIPADISDRLERVHGEPHIWWVGQFMKYLLRLQPRFQNVIKDYTKELKSPTVGIHVRRTDKLITEASFHSLEEYMVHVREYFDIQEKIQGKFKRSVFVASDDPAVISEAKAKYPLPEWNILGSVEVALSAHNTRYGLSGLIGVIKDVFVLAECDFLVCTFSSQICRLAYELLQAKHADASGRFVSLDDSYYYGGGISVIEIATMPHTPRNPREIKLSVADRIHVDGNHWNGMSTGTNLRTKKNGFYPSYKTRILVQKVNFPEKRWWLQAKPE